MAGADPVLTFGLRKSPIGDGLRFGDMDQLVARRAAAGLAGEFPFDLQFLAALAPEPDHGRLLDLAGPGQRLGRGHARKPRWLRRPGLLRRPRGEGAIRAAGARAPRAAPRRGSPPPAEAAVTNRRSRRTIPAAETSFRRSVACEKRSNSSAKVNRSGAVYRLAVLWYP